MHHIRLNIEPEKMRIFSQYPNMRHFFCVQQKQNPALISEMQDFKISESFFLSLWVQDLDSNLLGSFIIKTLYKINLWDVK